jgi:hypothetical protein
MIFDLLAACVFSICTKKEHNGDVNYVNLPNKKESTKRLNGVVEKNQI